MYRPIGLRATHYRPDRHMKSFTSIQFDVFTVPLFTVANGVVYVEKIVIKLGFRVRDRGSVKVSRVKVRSGLRSWSGSGTG